MINTVKFLSYICFILINIYSYNSHAKCANYTKQEYINLIPIFIQGQVTDYKYTRNEKEIISFNIENIKVLKGEVNTKNLYVMYENIPVKPSYKKFKNNEIYIFPVESIEGNKANISLSSCGPTLEISSFISMNTKSPINSEAIAIKFAKLYLESLTGETTFNNMIFSARRKNKNWEIEITKSCMILLKCEKSNMKLIIEDTGKLLEFIN